MRNAFGIVLVFWVIGCSVYQAEPVTTPSIEVLPFSRREGKVTVAGDPYVGRERSEAFFGQDLSKLGVIPIQLFVQNHGEGRLWLQPSSLSLILPDGTSLKPVRAMVVGTMETPGEFSRGEDEAIAHGAVIGAILLFQPLLGAGLARDIHRDKERTKVFQRTTDYWTKELKDVIVGKNESAHGFVFFVPNSGSAAFDEATVVYNLLDIDAAERFAIGLPLTGLGFSGTPKDP